MIRARVGPEPIDASAVLAEVGADDDGEALLFLGVVRNNAEGRPVRGMHYEAYREMAERELRTIAGEAAAHLGTDRVSVVHRTGDQAIGEVRVSIAYSSRHRAEAYQAARYVIEEIKQRLPVCKREHSVVGEQAWVEGTIPPRSADASVEEAGAVPRG